MGLALDDMAVDHARIFFFGDRMIDQVDQCFGEFGMIGISESEAIDPEKAKQGRLRGSFVALLKGMVLRDGCCKRAAKYRDILLAFIMEDMPWPMDGAVQ